VTDIVWQLYFVGTNPLENKMPKTEAHYFQVAASAARLSAQSKDCGAASDWIDELEALALHASDEVSLKAKEVLGELSQNPCKIIRGLAIGAMNWVELTALLRARAA
jgi:hypothetical protein